MKGDRYGYYAGVILTAILAICLAALMIAGTARLFDWIMP